MGSGRKRERGVRKSKRERKEEIKKREERGMGRKRKGGNEGVCREERE